MRRIENVYGLTPVQEGIYARYMGDRETEEYQLTDLFELARQTDIRLLEEALRLLPVRHPVLKTAFAVAGGAVKQVLLSDRGVGTETLVFDTAYTREALETAVNKKSALRFDLQNDPPAQCVFIIFTDRRFLLFRVHHLISDGRSSAVLLEDLTRIYGRLAEGMDAPALAAELETEREARTSFAAYVNLIRALDTEKAGAYWQKLLAGAAVPTLPKPFGAEARKMPVIKTAAVAPALLKRAEAFARENGVSVNTVFESAFALSLLKYTGGDECVFFKVLSGAGVGLPSTERTVGPMIATVPVLSRRGDGMTLPMFIKDLHAQSVGANVHGFLGLAQICRVGGIDPRAADVLFVFGNDTPSFPQTGTRLLTPIEHKETTEFALTANLYYTQDGCALRCAYLPARLPAGFAEGILNSFPSILAAMTAPGAADAQSNVDFAALTDLTEEEYKAAVIAPNATLTPFQSEKSVYDLFCKQTGNGTARVIDGDKTYSLARLDADAAKADMYIRGLTGGVKQVIGVLCDRSYAQLAAIFGIVRGGNAYLPLSPDHPPERIRGILADAGCKIVLAQRAYTGLTQLARPLEDVLASPAPGKTLPPAATPEDTLYVIYTSGSTGAPKGAMVSNRSAVNRIEWMAKRCFDADTVVMRKTPYTFDVSVWEIFAFAMFGFSLYILPPGLQYNQAAVLEHIAAGKVTDLHFVPTVFEQFLSVLRRTPDAAKKLGSLRRLILSGENLQAKHINLFRPYHGGKIQILNLYGPAECAVDVTAYTCAETETDPVPIGKPIANTRIYILDSRQRPVPAGTQGEICIGGENVGLGYLNDPSRTAQVFITDPFFGGRLYKTGDLGYLRPDGNIVFSGRRDAQVKLNGQRVEPGEIEAAVSALDGVESAAVLLKKDASARDVLCAYYTGRKTPPEELRASLGERLPRYMLPNVFCYMEALPLTSSGKTDLKALEKLPLQLPEQTFEAPLDETEAQICDAFKSVLHTENVGRNADFYELGGTSLNTVQLLSAPPLSELAPAEFLASPTPAALADKLRKKAGGASLLQPLYIPENTRRAFVLFPYAGGDASAFVELVRSMRAKHSDIALYYAGWETYEATEAAAREIRLLSQKTDVYFYSHCAGAVLAMRLLDILNADGPLIRGYIAAGSVPPPKTPFAVNLWPHLSDDAILRALQKGGLQTDGLAKDTLSRTFADFRRQTELFNGYFRKKEKKTDVDAVLLLSEKDPFTPNHAKAAARWETAVTHVQRLILLQTPTHYFQNTDTDRITELFSGSR